MPENSTLLKRLATVLSVLLHPVFVPTLLMAYLVFFSPNVFYGFPEEIKNWWLITVAYITLTFPLLTVLLLWRLKFISSIHMHELKERYGPLIASMLFYFWVFWLFHKQFQAPFLVQTLLLGTFLNTVLVFLSSIFFKISMHSSAWGSVFTFSLICLLLGADGSLWLLLTGTLLAGLIGTARLYLKAHIPSQVWTGYILGALSMPLAYGVVLLIS